MLQYLKFDSRSAFASASISSMTKPFDRETGCGLLSDGWSSSMNPWTFFINFVRSTRAFGILITLFGSQASPMSFKLDVIVFRSSHTFFISGLQIYDKKRFLLCLFVTKGFYRMERVFIKIKQLFTI